MPVGKRRPVFERGVPLGWCVERKASPKGFDRRSFRTVYFDVRGRRVPASQAVRGITVGCPKGQWDDKKWDEKFKTRGTCKVGTRVQRVMVAPGHYGCPSKRRARRR